MKKINVILVLVSLVGLLATSCVKDNEIENNAVEKKEVCASTAELLTQLKSTSYAGTYAMTTNAGHKSTDCGGKCKYYNGKWGHVDCQGNGHICTLRASINITASVSDKSTEVLYTGKGINDYEPIDEDTYNMPDRSFLVKDDKFDNGFIWINIPEQLLQRDTETHQFIYKEITFTKEPKYLNL